MLNGRFILAVQLINTIILRRQIKEGDHSELQTMVDFQKLPIFPGLPDRYLEKDKKDFH